VKRYEATYSDKTLFNMEQAVGDTSALDNPIADDGYDRAVEIYVYGSRPPARPKPPAFPPAATRQVGEWFKLTMLLGLSAAKALKFYRTLSKLSRFKIGAGGAVDVLFFKMWDTTNHLACTYGYLGGGIGVGLTALPSFSATTHGPWNSFKTSAAIASSDFGGPARFTTAGVGNWSSNWLNLLGTPAGVKSVYLKIDTGTTLGLGASTTVGDFVLLDGPDPFSGP
jgi:hypothetical protein